MMDSAFKKALNSVKASEELKRKTVNYILSVESNITPIHSVRQAAKKPVLMKRFVVAACAAILLCALPIGTYAVYKTPTSYVSVDINPSVELGINAFGKVVKVTPFNTDGQTILNGLSLMNLDVENAIGQIVRSASQNGFIHDDGSTLISITAETNGGAVAENLEKGAKSGAEGAIKKENGSATIETDHIGLDRRNEAITLGITPGKLNLIEKLQALDPAIKTDDYKNASVKDIQNKFHELNDANKGKNGNIGVTPSPSPSVSPSPSPSPSASPSASPSPSVSPASASPSDNNDKQKPHQNGNGNSGKKDDDTGSTVSPSPSTDNKPSPQPGSDQKGNNGNGSQSGNGNGNDNNNGGGKKN